MRTSGLDAVELQVYFWELTVVGIKGMPGGPVGWCQRTGDPLFKQAECPC